VYDFTWTSQASRRHLFTWSEFEALRANGDTFSDAYAARSTQAIIDGQRLSGQLVTGNYFSVLGVAPFLGRVLRGDDGGGVVVLSHDCWVTRFGADRSAVGRTISLIGQPHEIVGVAAPEFAGIRDYPADYWVPLTSVSAVFTPQRLNALDVTGRLKQGVSEDQARPRLEVWTRRITTDVPERERPPQILLESRATRLPLTTTIVAFFTLNLGLVGLILVVACSNAASMMLVRAAARERELAIRLSLTVCRPPPCRPCACYSFHCRLTSRSFRFWSWQPSLRQHFSV
jgi:hypothetical protein